MSISSSTYEKALSGDISNFCRCLVEKAIDIPLGDLLPFVVQGIVICGLLGEHSEVPQDVLKELKRGSKRMAIAIGEGANTSPTALKTKVGVDNKVYGRKNFVSGADKADYFMVLARSNAPVVNNIYPFDAVLVDSRGEGIKLEKQVEVKALPGGTHGPVALEGAPVIGRIGQTGKAWDLCTKLIRKYEDLLMGAWMATISKKHKLASQCMDALAETNNQKWLEAMEAIERDKEITASESAQLLLKIGSRVRATVAKKLQVSRL